MRVVDQPEIAVYVFNAHATIAFGELARLYQPSNYRLLTGADGVLGCLIEETVPEKSSLTTGPIDLYTALIENKVVKGNVAPIVVDATSFQAEKEVCVGVCLR